MSEEPKRGTRNGEETRARIVEVAQQVFARKGYSHAGLREIARGANVAVSLIVKHFGSKAGLFDEALTRALIDPEVSQSDRTRFGEKIVEAVSDPEEPMLAPTMIALSLGDEEARAIVERVAKDRILDPMAEWLGRPIPAERAMAILMLTTGYAIFTRPVSSTGQDKVAGILSGLLQSIVDRDKPV